MPILKSNVPFLHQQPQQQLQQHEPQQLAEAFCFLEELQSISVLWLSNSYTAALCACEGLVQFHDHLLLWAPETTPPLDPGSDYLISMWPQKAYLGTLLTKLLLSALPCPAINISSTLSGSRTGSIQPGGFDGTPDRGIGEQASLWVPQFNDSSTPHITSFSF